MNFHKLSFASVALVSAMATVAGCAVDAEDGSGSEGQEIEGVLPAGTCLQVDPTKVHSQLNVRSSPEIPTTGDVTDNVSGHLVPTPGPRSVASVLGSISLQGRSSAADGSWYHVRFQTDDGSTEEGYVKGENLMKAKSGGGALVTCNALKAAPNVEVAVASANVAAGDCLRVIDSQTMRDDNGLILRAARSTTSAHAGALGEQGFALVTKPADGKAVVTVDERDWYHVSIVDLATNKEKTGYVSGGGNFVRAKSAECVAAGIK